MSGDSTEDKITEIMTLIGVSPRDFARAATNFRSMPEAEFNTRLARLRAGEQRIESQRAETGLARRSLLFPKLN
jgi:hypothetical protein